MDKLSQSFTYSEEIMRARFGGAPVVALESAVITHGLPRPENLTLARELEAHVRSVGAVPATIAVLDGVIHIGLTEVELERLAYTDGARKISRRDFGIAIAKRESGGTTVAGTLIAGHAAGLQVFATGGIGGVHRQAPFDVSADLPELARTPMVVVCAGAKAILDIPATLEYLETAGVPVIGYQTDEFPAFYSVSSGRKVDVYADTPEQVAHIAKAQWGLGINCAILVVVPPPEEVAIPVEDAEEAIQQALADADAQHITGSALTPFLLTRVSELTGGASLRANLGLLRSNALIASEIALYLTGKSPMRSG
ncbi:MAG: pseudouridine-5'-phosphate glycosidase [Anaerolineaceae bacterium]|nr:pseudouridine-5'-phosphate glycosidase [Anaerolineaceae bacterium]